jgi:hypothetical protein
MTCTDAPRPRVHYSLFQDPATFLQSVQGGMSCMSTLEAVGEIGSRMRMVGGRKELDFHIIILVAPNSTMLKGDTGGIPMRIHVSQI